LQKKSCGNNAGFFLQGTLASIKKEPGEP